ETQFEGVDWKGVGLHYTGGTKPMVARIHAHWSERRGAPEQASYLGDDAVLRFESRGGTAEISLRGWPELTLSEITWLHTGIKPTFGDAHDKKKRYHGVAEKIHAFVREHKITAYRELLPPVYGGDRHIYLDQSGPPLMANSFHLASADNFKAEGGFVKW